MIFAKLFNKEAFQAFTKNAGMKFNNIKPELMLGFGAISVLTGTVYACLQTEKAKKELKEHEFRMETINSTVFEGTEKEQKMQKGREYTREYLVLTYKFLKLYGIPATLWFGGMGLIFGSHGTLRKANTQLVANSIAANNLLQEYRNRVAKAVGEENEQKIFMGAQEGMVQILEKDPETGEEKLIEKKADVFCAQPGSIFARNFTESTSDAFDVRSFADYYLDSHINTINQKLELGVSRGYTGLDILRMLGYNENALGEDENIDVLIRNGISGNARKVQDPEMRKLKVTRLRGYEKKYDAARGIDVYVPCLRLDFNFYPLEGMI